MGQCFARIKYDVDKSVHPDAWRNWKHHVARQYFTVGNTLGTGAFSEVVAAVNNQTCRRVALKVVFLDNPKLKPEHRLVLRNEVTVMQQLNHKNIAHVFCVMEDKVRRQIVFEEEMCHGGDLLEELQATPNNNNDRMLAFIMKQILQAVEYIHDAGVLHRDLKPDNVVFKYPHDKWPTYGAIPMLIDFGMATQYKERPPEKGLLGSTGFVAPELIEGGVHTPAMDMYALGVILYMMITGCRPMTQREANRLTYAKYESHQYPHMKTDPLWLSANAMAKDLVLRLLERRPEQRMSASQALKHPWITDDMRVHRGLSGIEDVMQTKRSRLAKSAQEAGMESFLATMALSMRQEKPRGSRRRPASADGGEAQPVGPAFSVELFNQRLPAHKPSLAAPTAELLTPLLAQPDGDSALGSKSHSLQSTSSDRVQDAMVRHMDMLPQTFKISLVRPAERSASSCARADGQGDRRLRASFSAPGPMQAGAAAAVAGESDWFPPPWAKSYLDHAATPRQLEQAATSASDGHNGAGAELGRRHSGSFDGGARTPSEQASEDETDFLNPDCHSPGHPLAAGSAADRMRSSVQRLQAGVDRHQQLIHHSTSRRRMGSASSCDGGSDAAPDVLKPANSCPPAPDSSRRSPFSKDVPPDPGDSTHLSMSALLSAIRGSKRWRRRARGIAHNSRARTLLLPQPGVADSGELEGMLDNVSARIEAWQQRTNPLYLAKLSLAGKEAQDIAFRENGQESSGEVCHD